MRPPRSRTWGRRGITPVIRVRGGGTGRVSVAGLACYRPGHRSRLIYRLHRYRGRKGETKAFTWTEYRDLLIAAHRQLPGGVVVLIWDNLKCATRRCGIEWRWKDSTAGQSQLPGEAEGSRGVGTHAAAGAALTTYGTGWHCQTAWVRQALRRRCTRGTAV